MALSSVYPLAKPVIVGVRARIRASSDVPVPDSLSSERLVQKRPSCAKLDALKYNDQPRQDYGLEVMYRFAGFDPFEKSTYFGPVFDLGQFERFRRIFHLWTGPAWT